MAKREKFSNRMESVSSVNTDLFTTDIKVNRSVWRNLSFASQCRINKRISDLCEDAYLCLDAEFEKMLTEQAEQEFLSQQVAMTDSEVEDLVNAAEDAFVAKSEVSMSGYIEALESDACIDAPTFEAVVAKNDLIPSIDKPTKKK